jgi:Arc/MetJ-type ribon-helix-helix transcriptional regulator
MSTQPLVVSTDTKQVDSQVDALDQYGRTEAERTVVLTSRDAERIDQEVAAGQHQTYDDALAYVIERGFAEIKRQRQAAQALRDARKLKEDSKQFAGMLKLNPALATDPVFVAKMIAALAKQ